MATYRRKSGGRFVTGLEEIDAVLQRLKLGAANKIARPALRKGVQVVNKAIRQDIPNRYKGVKMAIGYRVDSKGGTKRNQPQAKTGAAVGKDVRQPSKYRSGNNLRRGSVGFGPANVNWFLLGTGHRFHEKTNHYTGRMPVMLPGLVRNAFARSRQAAESAIEAEATRRIKQEMR